MIFVQFLFTLSKLLLNLNLFPQQIAILYMSIQVTLMSNYKEGMLSKLLT